MDEVRDAIQQDPDIDEGTLIERFSSVVARYPRYIVRLQQHFGSLNINQYFTPRAGWQTTLSDYLREQPDPRKVRWYFDKDGNAGKSYFATNYTYDSDVGSNNGRRPYIITGGRWADIFYCYKKERVVIFDWPEVS